MRPPVWSRRAAARVQEEQEEKKRREHENHKQTEIEAASEQRDSCTSSVDYGDQEYYEKLKQDQWTPRDCPRSFQHLKESLMAKISRAFARYTLIVYRRPWLVRTRAQGESVHGGTVPRTPGWQVTHLEGPTRLATPDRELPG